MNDNEWREECAYVSRLADLRGMVPEMDFSILVCIHYAHMMQSKATREGFYDAATYIGECLDDMKDNMKDNPKKKETTNEHAQ